LAAWNAQAALPAKARIRREPAGNFMLEIGSRLLSDVVVANFRAGAEFARFDLDVLD
jgi:hypothetical protein